MPAKGFSLTEILVAIVLMGVVILAVTSVDITSRRFFGTASSESWIQDEAKISMEHMVKNIQLGIGDMTNASTPVGSLPLANDSRGILILNASGNLINPNNPNDLGIDILVKKDTNENGKFDATTDKVIGYQYDAATHKIVYDEDVDDADNSPENLADGIVSAAIFTAAAPNQVIVEIQVRRRPTDPPDLDNPETTLTSSIILRAMSCD